MSTDYSLSLIHIYPAHVVHGCRNCSLDASIDSRCITRHASPSTNTENADALCIYIVTGGKMFIRDSSSTEAAALGNNWGAYPSRLANEKLTWETSEQTNICLLYTSRCV